MKRQQILEVLGYGFVALVFITIFTWIFHIFMAPAKQYEGFECRGGSRKVKIQGVDVCQPPLDHHIKGAVATQAAE